MNRSGHNFRPRACGRCGGDAYLDRLDEPEWRCLQCGRVVSNVKPLLAIAEVPEPEVKQAA
jgi:hypothetical protein